MTLLFLLALPAFCNPHLLLNADDIARMHKLAASEPWAAHVIADLIERGENWPASHVREFGLKEWALPKEGSGWSHDYVCPVHGVRLRQEGGRNICPVDGKDYHGWPVDNVVYMMRNDANAAAARDLGLAYRLTGKAEFSQKARRILNAYSELYPTLPIHDNQNRLNTKRGARVMSQTLSEAKWLVPLAFGYDLVRDSMPAAERARFETRVLRNAAAVIERNDMGTSNWQSWHNAALLAAGLLTGDRALANLAIDGPGGFRFQMREGIAPDGPWREGSWGYHFFALRPLLLTREMAVRAGIAVPEAAALKRMLDAPLACVFPDGTLPNFNDSGLVKLDREAEYYDIGYRLFHDARYVPLIRQSSRGLESLLWGAGSLPAGESPALSSDVLPTAGLATLRVRGSDHTLAIKFGPHGGGHGHFDKLTFIDYANGAHLAVDPGTQAYGAKTHATWDKMTVAHNTVVVDEKTQAAATGRLLEWVPLPRVTAIRASAGPVYPNVDMERTMVQTAEYTLDVVDVRSTDSSAHSFDWMYHNFGQASPALTLQPYTQLPRDNGYRHLTDDRAARTNERWQVTFVQPHCDLRMTMLA
ncbi:MAG: heparinase II/III domain-containing protein, partial [Bryobacteraceae bacterium]